MSNDDVLVIGAGFSGLCAGIKLKEAGIPFRILEKEADVGGTWLVNRYPGVACDVPAHGYCFSFELNPNWSTAFAPGHEIESYLTGVAKKYGMYEHCTFNAEVVSIVYDAAKSKWDVAFIKDGVPSKTQARFVVNCIGGLHYPAFPEAPGVMSGTFKGTEIHSAEWPKGAEERLKGKNVVVVGSAASAVQIVPEIESHVHTLTVLQRTPNWLAPQRGFNMPTDLTYSDSWKWTFNNVPLALRLYNANVYYSMEVLHLASVFQKDAVGNKTARSILTKFMKNQLKGNKALEEAVIPKYTTGCKRIIRSERFLPTLLKPHVKLVTSALSRVVDDGVVCANGEHVKADVIIYATGYRVGYLGPRFKICVPGAVELSGNGLMTTPNFRQYLGIASPLAPNFFTTMGLNSALGHNSVVVVIEAQVGYIVGVLKLASAQQVREVRLKQDVLDRYVALVDKAMEKTVWTGASCKSWYQSEQGKVVALTPFSTLRMRYDAAPPSSLGDYDCVRHSARI